MEENGSSYRLFFEASPDGMLLADGNERIVDANPAACRLLERTREEVMGSALDGLSDPSYPILEASGEELRATGSFTVGARFLRGDGSSFPAEVSVTSNGEGDISIILREAAWREDGRAPQASAAEYRALVEDSPDAMAVFNPDNTFRYANPAFERLLGYEPEELIGRFVPDIAHPEDLARGAAFVADVHNTRGPARIPGDFRYRHKDGHWVHLETMLNNLTHDPQVRGFVAICRDVTDRARAEEALKESERWFKTLIQNAPDLIFVLEENGTVRFASPSVERALGYGPEELVGASVQAYIHPDDFEEAELAVAAANGAAGMSGPLVRVRHKDGSYRLIEGFLTNLLDDPGVRGLVFNSRDVTDRVEAEQKLRESEERFRGLTENAQDFIALADENNVALYANPAIEQIMGYTPEEFVGTAISGYIHPDDLEAGLKNVAETLPIPGPHKLRTIRYRHKDGSDVYLEVVVNNRLEDPALRGVVCNCRDVTDRVEAEEKLRESEERFRALVENAQDFILLADENNVTRYVSPAIEQIMGYTPEEFVGTSVSSHIHPDDLERTLERVAETLPIPGPHDMGTIKYWRKDGSCVHLEVIVNNRLEDPTLRGVVCNCRDVTERVLAEQELRRSEEQLARTNEELARSNTELEQFAYVVSHGLRSPSRSVVGMSQLLLEDYADLLDEEGKGYLRSLEASGWRMQQIVEDILDLSRVTYRPLREEPVDLSALANSVIAERKENWPEREVEIQVEEGLAAEGDPNLLRLVLENLVGNAWKYASKKERARIEFGATEVEGKRAYFVRDDGAGFDMAYAGKLFEPFRRLHGPSEFEGTGIGLATVERVVSRHGGEIWAEGEVGRGATFWFTLGAG